MKQHLVQSAQQVCNCCYEGIAFSDGFCSPECRSQAGQIDEMLADAIVTAQQPFVQHPDDVDYPDEDDLIDPFSF